jgi:mannose/fructose/N-acetylgalactosamine-specific phosphotransferase system component IIC
MPHIGLLQAALIGLGYYLAMSPFLAGTGYFTLYRPLVAGLVVGAILGQPARGALVGAAINLVYLGFISAGGAVPGDPALAGWLGSALALRGHLDYGTAVVLAVPLGLLGPYLWKARMTVDARFVHAADRRAELGDVAGVARLNWLYPQLFLFAVTAVPVFLLTWLATGPVTRGINDLPAWLLSGLAVAGGLLPAIGIAMYMRSVFRLNTAPYFFGGYLLVVATHRGLPMLVVAGVGAVAAALHLTLAGDRRREPAAVADDADGVG